MPAVPSIFPLWRIALTAAIAAIIGLAMPVGAQAAALMGFADSGMLMGEVGRYYQEIMVNYSAKLGHAFGAEYMRMAGSATRPATPTGLRIIRD